ncbi:Plasmodium exported protein (PHIST), unknown function [Plasmodium ovale wallikeri]|uniref:Plasmodium RESA N-terminal domain-containing protein n=1 Tax=Plasmodium ovale wallikeri TaxID=864142 RepID=A0A1A8YM37_PLAOA|nr:Plasmodium exported protein (PHIST), unknown function [Plasmodium ovale wallikeri]SBT56150.1 Plasmodium exported protein (PHIST), unknown function [Plasmodium ovale wallikeri]
MSFLVLSIILNKVGQHDRKSGERGGTWGDSEVLRRIECPGSPSAQPLINRFLSSQTSMAEHDTLSGKPYVALHVGSELSEGKESEGKLRCKYDVMRKRTTGNNSCGSCHGGSDGGEVQNREYGDGELGNWQDARGDHDSIDNSSEMQQLSKSELREMIANLNGYVVPREMDTMFRYIHASERKKYLKMQENMKDYCEQLAYNYSLPENIKKELWTRFYDATNSFFLYKEELFLSRFEELCKMGPQETKTFMNMLASYKKTWRNYRQIMNNIWRTHLATRAKMGKMNK